MMAGLLDTRGKPAFAKATYFVSHAWRSWENMRVDFMNLKGQLHSLNDNSPEIVYGFLRERLRNAAWRTCILLRQGSQDALRNDDVDAAAEISRWARYLDGFPINDTGQMVMAEALA